MFRKMQQMRDCQFLKTVAFERKNANVNQRYLRCKVVIFFSCGIPANKNYNALKKSHRGKNILEIAA